MELDEAKKLITDLNNTISKLDPSVRARAFDILTDIAFEGTTTSSDDSTAPSAGKKSTRRSQSRATKHSTDDLGEFIDGFEHDKPADNLKLLIAWLYSKYGKYPMSLDSLKKLATEAGLTIPDKPDMTLKTASAKKKPMFQSPRRSHYQITTSGELVLKEKYGVKKGTNPLPAEDEE